MHKYQESYWDESHSEYKLYSKALVLLNHQRRSPRVSYLNVQEIKIISVIVHGKILLEYYEL